MTNIKRDLITGRMIGTPVGEKFPAIIKREKELSLQEGRQITFEKDYEELLLSGKMGVNEFCKRWEAHRSWILYGEKGRNSWVKQLNLPEHTLSTAIKNTRQKKLSGCQICGETNTILDFCHWIAKKNGGLRKYHNGFNGCPNCNRRLDHIVIPNIEKGRATDIDMGFYNKCKGVIHAFIDKEYKDDVEVREVYKRRVETRSIQK